MVALALVAQVDRLGQTFLVFALSILPALLVLGLTSYARLADLAVHDAYYARGIGRIRAFYFTLDPSAHQYWLLPPGDDLHALMRQTGQEHSRWHHFSHTATSVAAVTSMIAGVFAGLVASRLGASSLPVLGVLATVVAGGMFTGLFADQERRWRRSGKSEPTLFHPDGPPAVQARGLDSASTTATSAPVRDEPSPLARRWTSVSNSGQTAASKQDARPFLHGRAATTNRGGEPDDHDHPDTEDPFDRSRPVEPDPTVLLVRPGP